MYNSSDYFVRYYACYHTISWTRELPDLWVYKCEILVKFSVANP